jgi:monothiol glutaredoxin
VIKRIVSELVFLGSKGISNFVANRYNRPNFFQRVFAMSEEVVSAIKAQIADNPILLYMKGSPQAPQCGFSAQTVQCMVACGQRFAYVDILSNPEIRATLPGYANWPTFPQLWVGGELVGGCDIITEMFESGELQTLLEENGAADPAPE